MNSFLAVLPTIPISLLVWLLPLCWLIHSIEEIIMIDRWEMGREVEHRVIARHSILARGVLYIHSISRGPFIVAASLIGLLVVGATVAGTINVEGTGGWLYAMVLGGMFIRGFLHLGEAIVLRGYTPGILSGLFVVIPGAWFIYYRLFDIKLLDFSTAVLTSLVGIFVFVPAVIGSRLLLNSLFTSR